MTINVQAAIDNLESYEWALGARLIEAGKPDRGGLKLRAESGERLSSLLAKLGLVSKRDLADAISGELDLPLIGARDFPAAPLYGDRLSPRFLRKAQVVHVAEEADGLVVAMADPLNGYAWPEKVCAVVEASMIAGPRWVMSRSLSGVVASLRSSQALFIFLL